MLQAQNPSQQRFQDQSEIPVQAPVQAQAPAQGGTGGQGQYQTPQSLNEPYTGFTSRDLEARQANLLANAHPNVAADFTLQAHIAQKTAEVHEFKNTSSLSGLPFASQMYLDSQKKLETQVGSLNETMKKLMELKTPKKESQLHATTGEGITALLNALTGGGLQGANTIAQMIGQRQEIDFQNAFAAHGEKRQGLMMRLELDRDAVNRASAAVQSAQAAYVSQLSADDQRKFTVDQLNWQTAQDRVWYGIKRADQIADMQQNHKWLKESAEDEKNFRKEMQGIEQEFQKLMAKDSKDAAIKSGVFMNTLAAAFAGRDPKKASDFVKWAKDFTGIDMSSLEKPLAAAIARNKEAYDYEAYWTAYDAKTRRISALKSGAGFMGQAPGSPGYSYGATDKESQASAVSIADSLLKYGVKASDMSQSGSMIVPKLDKAQSKILETLEKLNVDRLAAQGDYEKANGSSKGLDSFLSGKKTPAEIEAAKAKWKASEAEYNRLKRIVEEAPAFDGYRAVREGLAHYFDDQLRLLSRDAQAQIGAFIDPATGLYNGPPEKLEEYKTLLGQQNMKGVREELNKLWREQFPEAGDFEDFIKSRNLRKKWTAGDRK